MVKFDETDKKIISLINEDWDQGITKIGRALNLSHTAIRSRLKRLKRDVLDISVGVDLEKLGLKLFMICAQARTKQKIIDFAKTCPRVVNYYSTYGEYNFIMLVVAEDPSTMESLIQGCFSLHFVEITKYTVLPIAYSFLKHIPIKFYSKKEKQKMKNTLNMACGLGDNCLNCEFYKKEQCIGCTLYEGYQGIL